MDQRDADDGVMVVTNSSDIGDEETVCDSVAEADNMAEAELTPDNTAKAVTDGRTGAEMMAAYIADAVLANNTAVLMADNTENPDTADQGHDDTERVALAYIPERPHYPSGGPRIPKNQDIPVQFDPSSDHRKEINIRIKSHGLNLDLVCTTIGFLCRGISPALIMHINPVGYVLPSTVLSLLIDILSTRLIMRTSTSSRPFRSPFLLTSGRCCRARLQRAGASWGRTIRFLGYVAAKGTSSSN
ncbi:hypothetical protein PIB30_090353 [Stylosanthes scabra]|uniref:Uncharacterized protein n=1 Tax=Stylosanthes scabra TaxID=79078 RepID=A0ABU6SVP3_9FABA|nr:hypothetical protein [Stylosanthes scabra]